MNEKIIKKCIGCGLEITEEHQIFDLEGRCEDCHMHNKNCFKVIKGLYEFELTCKLRPKTLRIQL